MEEKVELGVEGTSLFPGSHEFVVMEIGVQIALSSGEVYLPSDESVGLGGLDEL